MHVQFECTPRRMQDKLMHANLNVSRVHHLEIELSHSRTDAATLNAQLMFAIHQKVSLSQELDQWQVSCVMFVQTILATWLPATFSHAVLFSFCSNSVACYIFI